MGVKARAMVREVEMRWMVGIKSGCIEGVIRGGGDEAPSAVGLAGGRSRMAADRSERKLSRVEQMIRVVGAAWC